MHFPQSCGQLEHISLASQTPLPHCAGHAPQSVWQLLHDSPAAASQTPLPHPPPQLPQSLAQVLHDSPAAPSHTPSPHNAVHLPQSSGHLPQLSPTSTLHLPSPHIAGAQVAPHFWHSCTQELSHAEVQHAGSALQTQASQAHPGQPGLSLVLQPSPTTHGQSFGHPLQFSPASQVPLPQTDPQAPQSFGQVAQLSLALSHAPSPQPTATQLPSLHTVPLPQIAGWSGVWPSAPHTTAYGPMHHFWPGVQLGT